MFVYSSVVRRRDMDRYTLQDVTPNIYIQFTFISTLCANTNTNITY
jgi:hypothetical protein